MIEFLRSLDEKTALGLLARASLSLTTPPNPESRAILPDEAELREKLLAIARMSTGVPADDDSEEARERISDFLDREADVVAGPTDTQAALLRLAESGALPPDLYEIYITPAIKSWCLDFNLESELILETVRLPEKQQHFGASPKINEPSLVSIFIRFFRTRWPYKDFYLLVAGFRDGLKLEISQAWRIYPSQMSEIWSCNNLVEVLQAFAERYGAPVTLEGKTAKFFLKVGEVLPPSLTYRLQSNGRSTVGFSQTTQGRDGVVTSALVVFIDISKYQDLLKRMMVKREDIIFSSLKPGQSSVTN